MVDFIIILAVGALLTLAIGYKVKEKKEGKSGCGCSCSECPATGCSTIKIENNKNN